MPYIVTSFSEYVNENLDNEKIPFIIPEQLQKFYKVYGDLSNIKNWSAKIILGNNLEEGKSIGDWDDVGYVLISLSTNYIIPVARSDEHQKGYELLDHLMYEYKLRMTDYQSVWTRSTNYVYDNEPEKEFASIKKAYEYGARDFIVKNTRTNHIMSVEEYVTNGGDFKKAKKIHKKNNKVSIQGQKFIDKINKLISLFEAYHRNNGVVNSATEKEILNNCGELDRMIISNDILYKKLIAGVSTRKNYNLFEKSMKNSDLDSIEATLFGFGGFKNTIHRLLKKDDEMLDDLFWSTDNALEQFDAMSTGRI